MNKKIVFLGFPGSGKGTQSALLVEHFGIYALSTGDAFRAMIKHGKGKIADQVRAAITEGRLVSDELTFSVVKESLDKHPNSWLLDGFPRDIHQAEMLDAYNPPGDVVFFDLEQEKIFQRLNGRRLAKGSGKVYNIHTCPPKQDGLCDISGEELVLREDDKPEAVAKRMEVYHRETKPLINYYEGKGVLRRVNADRDVDQVFSDLKRVLGF